MTAGDIAALTQAFQQPAPWLQPWCASGHQVLQAMSHGSVAEGLNAVLRDRPVLLPAGPLRFVPQAELPAGEAYEAFIARTACVPTRNNPHDFFNGLAWLRYPAVKARLNALQAQQLAQANAVPGTRGAVRDALTVFDENAALWCAPPVLVNALRDRDWAPLFIAHRALWRDAPLRLFGHALLEKLLQPRKPITAHVWVVEGVVDGAVDDDAAVAQSLSLERLAAKPFLPLPVLGVPGWWPANESADFYRDAQVFRPARR